MLMHVKVAADTGRSTVVNGEEDDGGVNWQRWHVLAWLRLLCQHGQIDKHQDNKVELRVKNMEHTAHWNELMIEGCSRRHSGW